MSDCRHPVLMVALAIHSLENDYREYVVACESEVEHPEMTVYERGVCIRVALRNN